MSDLLDRNPNEPRWRLPKADLLPFACFGICFFILLFCLTWTYLVPAEGYDLTWWYRTIRSLLVVCAAISSVGIVYGVFSWRKAGRVGKSATFGNVIFASLSLVTIIPAPFTYAMF